MIEQIGNLEGTINKAVEIIVPTLQEKEVTPTEEIQTILPDENFDALSKVVVDKIPNEYIIPNFQTKNITITQNETQEITPDANYNGLEKVNIEVAVPEPVYQEKTITPSENVQNVTPDEGYDALNKVVVNEIPSQYIVPSGTLNISQNGNYDVKNKEYANVSVTPNLESKSITINTNTTTTITPTQGKDGISSIEVITNVPGEPNWSAIGYSSVPQSVADNYNYAKQIYDNWDSSTTSMYQLFKSDSNLITIPLIDTSNVTSIYEAFYGCSYLKDIPLLNTSNVTNMSYAFQNCSSLETFPLIDTSNVTAMGSMFANCYKLKNFPLLNTSRVTTMQSMFGNTRILTDESINNILKMCINASEFRGRKNLDYMGFNSAYYPASRIQALSNYQDFINAGWTIGYS